MTVVVQCKSGADLRATSGWRRLFVCGLQQRNYIWLM